MKIAVLSDIHANLYALDASLNMIKRDGVDLIIHAGDLVGYGPHPNEVISRIRDRGIDGVKGNYDKGIGEELGTCGCRIEDESDSILKKMVFGWTDEQVTKENRRYLAKLHFEMKLEVGALKIGVWHASPTGDNVYWYEDRSEKFFKRMAQKALCDIVIFGHTHIPFHTEINGVHFINAGSVGKPKDGDVRASYAYLEVDPRRGKVFTYFPRVEYDLEALIEDMRTSTLPEDLIDQFCKGV